MEDNLNFIVSDYFQKLVKNMKSVKFYSPFHVYFRKET